MNLKRINLKTRVEIKNSLSEIDNYGLDGWEGDRTKESIRFVALAKKYDKKKFKKGYANEEFGGHDFEVWYAKYRRKQVPTILGTCPAGGSPIVFAFLDKGTAWCHCTCSLRYWFSFKLKPKPKPKKKPLKLIGIGYG